VPLTQLGLQKARAELLLSIREIETHGVPAPRLCAYPNGDYDEDVVESVKSAGLVLAFTTEPGRVAPGSDPYRLPRVNVHETAASTPPQFLCRLLGLF
jgi:peptidoglycan/xylan/chitin deacetylase (PgdA/CDA1 family)